MKPNILLTNDDGVNAKGINMLVETLSSFANVLVMAPDGARSGSACAITSYPPLRYRKVAKRDNVEIYSCSGTPVDCVKLALEQFPQFKPDMVVSGINHGDNASVSVHYSGTMGAVLEGSMKGIPSIGFSICDSSAEADFSAVGCHVQSIVRWVFKSGLPKGVCLNVNFPKYEGIPYKGVQICRMAQGAWTSEWCETQHPSGQKYFWLTGQFVNLEPEDNATDISALERGFVAITPIRIDMTAYHVMNDLKELECL